MKTLNVKNLTYLILGVLLIVSVACDKKGSDPAPAAPVHQYGYVNGSCYDITTNTPAAANLCTGVVQNAGYRWNGTQCLDVNNQPVAQTLCNTTTSGTGSYRWNGTSCTDLNGAPIAPTLCQTNSNVVGQYQLIGGECYSSNFMWVSYTLCSGVGGFVPNQCHGTYVMYQPGFVQTIYCSGTSCSGKTLIEYYTGRQIVCP